MASVGEKVGLSLATSQLIENPAEIFEKIENFFLRRAKLSVNSLDVSFWLLLCGCQSHECF